VHSSSLSCAWVLWIDRRNRRLLSNPGQGGRVWDSAAAMAESDCVEAFKFLAREFVILLKNEAEFYR
jgi:hypothetical protein